MIKKQILWMMCLLSWAIVAQETSQLMPEDSSVKKGVLANGMTYYIKKTTVTKNVASYYIIQNVGSVLETEEQRGLAHFLEHMAFNGTKNFKGKGILDTLEKEGLVFGKDINAYTSFDETVYNINNLTSTPKFVDLGLLILYDWSNNLLLTDDEIDAERGVIKEEWRTRQSGGMRVLQQQLPVMFNHSLYASRMPIGLMEVVENFDAKTLRSFYHDWYRTDLQAIAVVGDVDVNAVETKIKKMFSRIPSLKNPKPRPLISIPDHDGLQFVLAMDKEVASSSITFGIRHPKKKGPTSVTDFKTSLFQGMALHLLSRRLQELSVEPDASFLSARVGYGTHSRATNSFKVHISPKANKQEAAFYEVMTAVQKAIRFGFTPSEIQRVKIEYQKYYQNQLQQKQKWSHKHWVAQIKNNYLYNETITDLQKEYEWMQEIFKNFLDSYLQNALKNLYKTNNRYVMVTGVEGHQNLNKQKVVSALDEIENNIELQPYKDSVLGKTLLGNLQIKPGKIVEETSNEVLDAKTFVLSNGLKVHYKYVTKNKNQVELKAISSGGMSLVSNADLPSASLLKSVVQYSGLGNYTATELTKVLAGKSANTTIYLNGFTETISGGAVTEDVKTLLEQVYLRFEAPRFDEEGYEVVMQNVSNYLTKKSQRVNDKMKDSLVAVLYGNKHPRKRILDSTFVREVSFAKIKKLYKERFSNPEDFEFFIVGDVKEETLKPMIEKYIGSLPTHQQKLEKWKPVVTPWVAKKIKKQIEFAMKDPKTSVRIAYKTNYTYSLKNLWIAKALDDVLQLRFTESLREDKGGTYGASVNVNLAKRPEPTLSLSIKFDCDPEKANELIEVVNQELNAITKGKIKAEDLLKTVTNYLKEREDAKNYNRYDMSLLLNFYREGYYLDAPENFLDLVRNIKENDLKMMLKKLLKNGDTYQIVFDPLTRN